MIDTNTLKIIAIIAMIIDHIGSYFVAQINQDLYYIFRIIGRIVMPIFLYLLIQGFFHTKNIKKYIFRVFCLATITQVILLLLGIINQLYFPEYYTRVNEYIGILFSYTLSLIFISMLEYKCLFKKLNKYFNLIFRLVIMATILIIYLNIDIEFDMRIPFMCVELYIIEKIFMDKQKNTLLFNRKFNDKKEKWLYKIIYYTLIFIAFITSLDFSAYHPGYKYSIMFSIIPLLLYNGKRKNKNKFIQILFYAIFPAQHMGLYLLAMLV